jgi:hypothetical protein
MNILRHYETWYFPPNENIGQHILFLDTALGGRMSNLSTKSKTDSSIKRADNVPVLSVDTSNANKCTSLSNKMDSCLDTAHLDFYESDLAIAQFTKKLRAEDLKVVTSIAQLGDFSTKGTLDTPEVSLNLSDYLDTPDFNKFTSPEGLFPQVDLLTANQENKSDSVMITTAVSVTTPHSLPLALVPIKQEPVVDVIEIELTDSNSDLMSHQSQAVPVMETIDISSLVQPQSSNMSKNVVVKKEVSDMGSYVNITIPESNDISEESRPYEYDYVDNVPTPVQEVLYEDYANDEYHGKSPPPSKMMRKYELEKGSDEYKQKRERNNVAVRKSREKARERQQQTEQKVKTLSSENKQLTKKLELATKELTVLRGLFSNANLRGLLTPQHQKLFDKLNR